MPPFNRKNISGKQVWVSIISEHLQDLIKSYSPSSLFTINARKKKPVEYFVEK